MTPLQSIRALTSANVWDSTGLFYWFGKELESSGFARELDGVIFIRGASGTLAAFSRRAFERAGVSVVDERPELRESLYEPLNYLSSAPIAYVIENPRTSIRVDRYIAANVGPRRKATTAYVAAMTFLFDHVMGERWWVFDSTFRESEMPGGDPD